MSSLEQPTGQEVGNTYPLADRLANEGLPVVYVDDDEYTHGAEFFY